MIWIAVSLFLVSLLAVCKPPFYQAWLLSVAVAGLPWLFALISLAVLLVACFRGQSMFEAMGLTVLFFLAAAFILYCVPIVRAFSMAGGLEKGLREAFPEQSGPQGKASGAPDTGTGPGTKIASPGSAPDPGTTMKQQQGQLLQPGQSEQAVRVWKQRSGQQLSKAFRFWRMFTGPLAKKVPFKTMCYYRSRSGTSDYGNPGCYLELDFYPSQASGPSYCIIVIHGGSWSSGHRRQLPELNSRLAGSGYHVAAINYRLAPQYQSPLAVEDVKNAIAFLRKHAVELGIAPDRFVLLGRSAGGQIALQAAYALCDPGIRGVIAYYAPADMVWGYSAPASRLIMDSCKVMETYLGGSYSVVPENYHSASPLEALARHAIPTLLLHGKNDVLVAYEHSVRLARALHASETSHYLLSLPGGTHGFDYVLDGPEGQLATYAVRYFLKVILAQR